ncbi:hypothetical protein CMI47_08960 [Candidatus Pacearchaeota archaeon]|nr:hypothetical protein [Candidatus Pacearchaeota archaeon]|tara:strand:- start:216 stop:650 length:435 start_codon:yes stop_codon:yes gene_type:complete
MINSWSKEDLANFDNSEVFKELEKKVIETVKRAEILQAKINSLEKAALDVNTVKAVKDAYPGDPEGAGAALGAMDDNAFDEVSDEVAEDSLDLEDDTYDVGLQNEVLDDLRGLVEAALQENNVKLAYRIERTIDEILEQDVACE